VANALWVWWAARAGGGRVILRIEDHDRQRCRPEYDAAIIEDLAWLGLRADAGPFRQADDPGPYAAALARLRDDGLSYACDCSRTTFDRWSVAHGRAWDGSGCPGGCRERLLSERSGMTWRVALGQGVERFDDLRLGTLGGPATRAGDLVVRDRRGNWSYHLCVVVDDARQGVDLVIRGEDLLDATPSQLRLQRLLGLPRPTYLHHPLIRKPGGAKLSKADGDTGVRDLRSAGWTPQRVLDAAERAAGPGPAGAPDLGSARG
jgi:glutamyl/glutaminyl-tRNA synthetase